MPPSEAASARAHQHQLGPPAVALVTGVVANRGLRMLVLSTFATSFGKWGFGVALGLYAYRVGGATLVGAVALMQALPSVAAGPTLALLGDRYSRKRVLLGTNVLRTALLAGVAASIASGAPPAVAFVLAILYSVVSTANQPARAALVPMLARVPSEASATNAVLGSVDNAGFLLGAGAGGLIISETSTQAVVAICAGAYLVSLWWIAALPLDPRRARRPAGALRELAAGFRTIASHHDLRVVLLLVASLSMTDGLTNVLVIVTAIAILHAGAAGVGYLNVAYGLGGVLAGGAALALLKRSALAAGLLIGALAVGAPLALVGGLPSHAVAVLAWVACGLGYALAKSTGLTLLQRLTPDLVLARVLGVLEVTFVATIGLGAILATGLVNVLGARSALVATGLLLPVVVMLRWRSLRRLEAGAPVPGESFQLLRRSPIFAPLPIATTESLARSARDLAAAPGEEVITQGDHGDAWYMIKTGEVEVLEDGAVRRRLGPGDGFGEIALLRDVPRTATVRAVTPTQLLELDRKRFLTAVTGLGESHQAAHRVADGYLEMEGGAGPTGAGGGPEASRASR